MHNKKRVDYRRMRLKSFYPKILKCPLLDDEQAAELSKALLDLYDKPNRYVVINTAPQPQIIVGSSPKSQKRLNLKHK